MDADFSGRCGGAWGWLAPGSKVIAYDGELFSWAADLAPPASGSSLAG